MWKMSFAGFGVLLSVLTSERLFVIYNQEIT
jgi:hypothetical protein